MLGQNKCRACLESKVIIEKKYRKNGYFLVFFLCIGQTVRSNLGTHTKRALRDLSNALFLGASLPGYVCADLSKNVEKNQNLTFDELSCDLTSDLT